MADASLVSSHNGSGVGTLAWEPETPFLNAPVIPQSLTLSAAANQPYAVRSTIESPFSAEYAGEDAHSSAHAEAFATLMGEFHDEEFTEALEDLVNDASAVLEEGFSSEIGDPERERFAMERTLGTYLEPLGEATDGMLDRMMAGLGGKDLSGLSDPELEALLESFAPTNVDLSPPFEGFLSGVFKKAKQAVKGAVKIAKKVAGAVAFPHLLILNRLKGLVRPLLERVLRFAIDKLPVALRPLASQFAQRFLGIKVSETASQIQVGYGSGDQRVDASAANPASLEEELDARLAGYLLAGEQFELEAGVEEYAIADRAPAIEPMQALDRARGDFAEGVVRQQPGKDPAPLVEQFVPAILAALRIGINVVGRPRVVKFLAGLVAKLIAKYIGQQQAPALSRALVDAGLRAISLEAYEESEAAGHALAATVEDTVNRLVQAAPTAAWQSEALLEAYVQEAFQQAASANFPDPLIREELHEASEASGAWVPLPAKTPRKRYKKYTRVPEVSITPQVAAAIKTFGGIPLRSFLKDRLGVVIEQPIRARVHFYEALPGTRLSLIALHERGVAGLGSAKRHGWSLFHPLTPEAAGLLLKEPGLGRAVPASFLVRRRVTAVGQRFYYLEIPGARVRFVPRTSGKPSRPARSSQTRIVIDFVKRQLRVGLYYSEADAQDLAKQLRQKLPLSALLKAFKARHDVQLGQILSGEPTDAVRIVHEAAPTEELAAPLIAPVLRVVGRQLSDVVVTWMLEALKRELETRYDRFLGEFERAVQADEDGLTITVVVDTPSLLEQLRRLLKPGGILAAPATVAALARQTIASYRVELHAGFAQI